MPAALLLVLVFAGAAADEDAPAQWRLDGALSMGFDSNPANAEAGRTLPATGFASSALSATWTLRPRPRCALLLRGALDGQQYLDYVGLSNARETGTARLFYRPWDSFRAPTLSAWAQAAGWQFGSHMRSGAEYRAGVAASQLLNTAFRLRVDTYGSRREAESRVFEGRQAVAALNLDWFASDSVTAYAGYEFHYGDFAESSSPDSGAAAAALAWTWDDALRLDGRREITYRLRGHAQVGTLGLNVPLNDWLALDAQGREFHTRASSGDHYNRWLAELSLLARF